jgi:cysteine synthase A
MTVTVSNLTALIGDTPMVELKNMGSGARIFAKLESCNPGSSVKDRIALAMIEAAEADGSLPPGATIVEPTSGNTGIGLAMVGGVKGYKVVLTMPESMSIERRKLLRSLGAEIVLTAAKDGMQGAIGEAELLQKELGAFMPRQFENPANPAAHYRTTGPEIWQAMDGKVDVLVSGVGTGGTLSGAGRFIKEKNPNAYVVAVEPAESAVISGGPAGPHMIQGIGAGFIPKALDVSLIDEPVQVSGADAIETAKRLAATEAIMAGISSGAALYAALQVASRDEFKESNIVVILPDTSERYASTLLFYED